MKSYLILIFICFAYLPSFGNKCYLSADTGKEISISNEVIEFAKTLIGTPYKYAAQEPNIGFDCSGFVNYVFAHFNIKVPRISREFASIGKEIMVEDAKIGDIILFTGTNTNDPTIGHVGIITSNDNGIIQFIHSSSGKNIGVIISNLEGYYQTRLVKIIQLLN
jgi:cell wall-associated NlpC family hydrolase